MNYTYDVDLNRKLEEWERFYNFDRPHGVHDGKTPYEQWLDLSPVAPLHEEVEALYDPAKERIQLQNYHEDLQVRKVKRSG